MMKDDRKQHSCEAHSARVLCTLPFLSSSQDVDQDFGRMKKLARCVKADEGQDVTNGLTVNRDGEGHGSAVQVRRTRYKLVWCGGTNLGQDVTIRLVPHGLSRNGRKETVQLLKVHSFQLLRCSKYFETCLSERWSAALSNADAYMHVEFALEVHGDLACYRDCLSQMYSSYCKEIHSVEYSLALLKVASQIEYRDLMDHIVRHLSAIVWSEEDEIMSREYSSSPDFPRNCASDLVVRLGLDGVEEELRENLCDMIEQSVCCALENHGTSSSDFIESLLVGMESEMSSSFAKSIVIGIIIKIAKKIFEEFSVRCVEDQPDFTEIQARAMNWIWMLLLDAGVAEELVKCLVHIKSIPEALIACDFRGDFRSDEDCIDECFRTARVLTRMCEEVTSGRLPLRTAELVAVFRNWHRFLIFYSDGFGEPVINLFSTLLCKVQIVYLKG